jgi:acylphosphatase
MIAQAHLYIKGDVIGVGFRAWTKIQSKMNHVTGWVRNVHNKPDIFGPGGGVEAVLQGDEDDVVKMIEIIHEGPPIAHVQDVQVIQQDVKDVFETFEIRK